MTGNFQYVVLKYRHSYIAGEVFNIGILFLFDSGEIKFLHPRRIGRISALFSNFPISLVKNTLNTFRYEARKLSKAFQISSLFKRSLEEITTKHFISENAGAIFFAEIKQGVYNDTHKQLILEHFYKIYLGNYDDELIVRKNEKYIIDRVKTIIKDKYPPVVENRFKVNKVLQDSQGDLNETFEYGWQNGKLNLITPIAFDLASESNLKAKALHWYSILNLLKEPAEKENIIFDLLTTEPKDLSLRKYYYKSLDIIKRADAPINIVEEDDYLDYLNHAVQVVLDHENETL